MRSLEVIMGAANHAIEKPSQAFARKARYEGWECGRCGETPIYDERDVFFTAGLCGYCAHVVEKSKDE